MWHNFKSKWWTVRWEEKSEARVMVICWLDTLAPPAGGGHFATLYVPILAADRVPSGRTLHKE